MLLTDFIARVERINKLNNRRDDARIMIQDYRPGSLGGTPCVGIDSIHSGFDWDAGKVIITPEQKVTSLTTEEVEAILTSAREGQSWHAYQIHKKQQDKIKALEAEIKRLQSATQP